MTLAPDIIAALRDGPFRHFEDPLHDKIPPVAAGVYTVWDQDTLVYVGMAGRSLTADDTTQGRSSGLASRLRSHASGRRSGNQFCIYVADRLVLPTLSARDIAQIADGSLSLDRLTRDYIRSHLTYRYALLPDGTTARTIERAIQKGALGHPPSLNPVVPRGARPAAASTTMSFIGVDLAWTTKGTTGLCLVQNGLVVESATAFSDDDIIGWLGRRQGDAAVVAFDAPLIIRNATGRRPCEQLISQVFGGYDASAHSCNLNRPGFEDGGRAARIASSLGLCTNPDFPPGERALRAIEVYPHPATVALFDLPKTLKYKPKAGRTVESRRLALLNLLGHLESLREHDPRLDVQACSRWTELREAVANGTSGAAFSRVEDEIDAYVCAYVALYYWTHGPDLAPIFGDTETGYIITPANAAQRARLAALVSL